MVDIKGLSKAAVIQALYASAKPQGLGFLHYVEGDLPRSEAEGLVGQSIDYLHGRVMKVKIDGDQFNESLYDRDNGTGAAKRAIRALLPTPEGAVPQS